LLPAPKERFPPPGPRVDCGNDDHEAFHDRRDPKRLGEAGSGSPPPRPQLPSPPVGKGACAAAAYPDESYMMPRCAVVSSTRHRGNSKRAEGSFTPPLRRMRRIFACHGSVESIVSFWEVTAAFSKTLGRGRSA